MQVWDIAVAAAEAVLQQQYGSGVWRAFGKRIPRIKPQDAKRGLVVGDVLYLFNPDSSTVDKITVAYVDHNGVPWYIDDCNTNDRPYVVHVSDEWKMTPREAILAYSETIEQDLERLLETIKTQHD